MTESKFAGQRDRILALPDGDRALLAEIMRKKLDEVPGKITALRADEQVTREWLAEFAPHLRPAPAAHIAVGPHFTTVTIDGATVAVLWRSELTRLWYVTDGTNPASEHTSRNAADVRVAEHVAHALELVSA